MSLCKLNKNQLLSVIPYPAMISMPILNQYLVIFIKYDEDTYEFLDVIDSNDIPRTPDVVVDVYLVVDLLKDIHAVGGRNNYNGMTKLSYIRRFGTPLATSMFGVFETMEERGIFTYKNVHITVFCDIATRTLPISYNKFGIEFSKSLMDVCDLVKVKPVIQKLINHYTEITHLFK